jgi:hypothetical protein
VTKERAEAIDTRAVCVKTIKPSRKSQLPRINLIPLCFSTGSFNDTPPYTARFCGIIDRQTTCEDLAREKMGMTGANLTCSVCERDLCNYSSGTDGMFWFVSTAAIAALAASSFKSNLY